mmetsp:Transcript_24049/g.51129  ORF Transcript_24049/g.51129 Transcript_24049/m.51129 type:complete len:164 (+) Transcript_24049:110-601(+)|eukprot:CAMPEP_0201123606 /NCGR_PEP_ID=MMETSP0850-20130426/8060_1 /ASSEMBLY_ACC=CAM_ASM_000622 /TAXON_ID=183588 /ORGANISM="Pseudo-nitzschia fraudulenta, Strain WWA7" /LENGTH=163 /DNA_ID=CAMNT_0047390603 /DNA_START=109 /DNA_END=600 /DNA_ORIENTATION=+
MKISVFVAAMAIGGATAFAPNPTITSSSASQLNLFGGGSKDGEAKGPGGGMMDQLAMFKKAQEMAQKKQKLDQELASESYSGSAADGKVTVSCSFSPSKNPMDPQPDYKATGFDFDADWYEAASPEDLSTAVKEALMDGIDKTNEAVKEKYKLLEEDLKNLQN